jgi:hypothetical protein
MTPGRFAPAGRRRRRITGRPAAAVLLLLLAGLCQISCRSSSPRFEPESIRRLQRSPSSHVGRAVLLHGVAVEPISEPAGAETVLGTYYLQDENGRRVLVLTRRLPAAGTACRVAGFVGQLPQDALSPLVLETKRSRPPRDLSLILGLLALVLGSVPAAATLLKRRGTAAPAIAPRPEVRPGIDYLLDLVVVAGPDAGKKYTFREDRILVGRPGLRDNDLSLDDQTVSRTQAVILRDGKIGGYKIRNEGRTNPLKVNGRPCDAVALRDGDLLTVGRTTLQVGYREPAAPDGAGPGTGSRLLPLLLLLLPLLCAGRPALAGGSGSVELELLDLRELPRVTCRFRMLDPGGAVRPGLGPDDFRLLVDGRTLENAALRFDAAPGRALPRLVLVVQATREEQGRGLFLLKTMVSGFLERWPVNGPVALISHGAGSRLEQGFTTDRHLLLERLEAVRLGQAEDRGYYEALERAASLFDGDQPGPAAVVYFCRPGIFTRGEMRLDAPKGLRAYPGVAVYPVLHPEREGGRVKAFLRQLALKLTDGFTGHYTLTYTSPGGEDNRVHSLRIDRLSPETADSGTHCRYLAVSGTGLEAGVLLAAADRRSLLDRLSGILLGLLGGGLAYRWITGRRWPAVKGGGGRPTEPWRRVHFLVAGAMTGFLLSQLIGRVM